MRTVFLVVERSSRRTLFVFEARSWRALWRFLNARSKGFCDRDWLVPVCELRSGSEWFPASYVATTVGHFLRCGLCYDDIPMEVSAVFSESKR